MHDVWPFVTVGKTAILEATIGGSNDLVTAEFPLILAKNFYKVKGKILVFQNTYINIKEFFHK